MRNVARKNSINMLVLPAINEKVWQLLEGLIKEETTGQISLEVQSELISQMKKFNDKLISVITTFSKKNTMYFSKRQSEKIRENLQFLINDIFFDRMTLEMNYQVLKKQISDQFSSAMPVISDQK